MPQSVSVISGEALQEQHSQRLSDYLTKIPSANIVENQAGNSRIVLRGINTGGTGATVATYIDETPIGSATGLANGAVLAFDLDPSDLERVEVLRGPQGTLYGANSLGGLVKYVTVAPSTGQVSASAEAGIEISLARQHRMVGASCREHTVVSGGRSPRERVLPARSRLHR